ncbi:hypothetical protein ACFROC_06255 [Nocardia tengchongensis]|uniref:hypothetical protein n=1 Tax=Nocardia tengchongensis TaxID=2055889 RepID=UPI0036B79E47
MAKSSGKQPEINENPLIAELLAHGVENARVLQGFIGPSHDERYVTLYQDLRRLGDSVDISRDDILHTMKVPQSTLGAVVLWIKDDAQISVRRTETDAAPTSGPGSLQEVTQGRLRMKMRTKHAADCMSVCMDCLSWCSCSICTSQCKPQ